MTIQQKIDIIKSHPLFESLQPKKAEKVAEVTKEKVFPPKTVIVNQSEPASAVYFVYHGLLKIYLLSEAGKVIPIRVKQAPYVIGELNVFDDESTINIETIQETHALVLSKTICKELILENPDFAFNLLKTLTEKLHVANKQTDHYLSIQLKERLWQTIQTIAPYFPEKKITLSQEEFSFIVGASRARVTELLNEFAKENLISLSHRKIQLL